MFIDKCWKICPAFGWNIVLRTLFDMFVQGQLYKKVSNFGQKDVLRTLIDTFSKFPTALARKLWTRLASVESLGLHSNEWMWAVGTLTHEVFTRNDNETLHPNKHLPVDETLSLSKKTVSAPKFLKNQYVMTIFPSHAPSLLPKSIKIYMKSTAKTEPLLA